MTKLAQLKQLIDMLTKLGIAPPQVQLVLKSVQALVNYLGKRRETISDADLIQAMEGAFEANLKRDNG